MIEQALIAGRDNGLQVVCYWLLVCVSSLKLAAKAIQVNIAARQITDRI
jgi:hypothetical protein